jgi:hypothetical protein
LEINYGVEPFPRYNCPYHRTGKCPCLAMQRNQCPYHRTGKCPCFAEGAAATASPALQSPASFGVR